MLVFGHLALPSQGFSHPGTLLNLQTFYIGKDGTTLYHKYYGAAFKAWCAKPWALQMLGHVVSHIFTVVASYTFAELTLEMY